MRYDAAIIGAGAEGLASAAMLAGSGATTIVIERAEQAGGRLVTREFHPGFRVSPFADEWLPVPRSLHWALDLARRGVIFRPEQRSLALWSDGRSEIDARDDSGAARLLRRCRELAAAANARAHLPVPRPSFRLANFRFDDPGQPPWPGVEFAHLSLRDAIGRCVRVANEAAHLAAMALCGRSGDPDCRSSALHLLTPGQGAGGVIFGGAGRLGGALFAAAKAKGAHFLFGLEASEIRRTRPNGFLVVLADGREIEARAVISTLDLKRTFFCLFPWHALAKPLAQSAARFRYSGAAARVLLALARVPKSAQRDALSGAVHVRPDMQALACAHDTWRSGTIPDQLPTMLRIPSLADPGLAPPGAAVMTVTLGSVPGRLFDSAWTHERRETLRRRVLQVADGVWPGTAGSVVAAQVIVPGDIEDTLGATEGDLDAGEIAADQMLDLRPWPDCPRTPVEGLYLGGGSSAAGPFGTGAAGVAAAGCLLADLKGRGSP